MNQPEEPASADHPENNEGEEWTQRLWNGLTSVASHTLAGMVFAIPGLFLAVIISIAWPAIWSDQYYGFYLIGMLTLILLVSLEDLGTTGKEQSGIDTSELGATQILKLIIALVLSTSVMVSLRLLVATFAAAVVAVGLTGLPAILTTIAIATIDHRLTQKSPYISIGGLGGIVVLQLMSHIGLRKKEQQGIRNINMPIGTMR